MEKIHFYSHWKEVFAGTTKVVAATRKSILLIFKTTNIICEKYDSPNPTMENALNQSMK
jgi:hypothetical protein